MMGGALYFPLVGGGGWSIGGFGEDLWEFDMDTMLWACAGIALASAILAVIFLPRRTESGAPGTANAGAADTVPDENGAERAELEA